MNKEFIKLAYQLGYDRAMEKRGFTLVELLTAAGLASGLGYGAYKGYKALKNRLRKPNPSQAFGAP